MRARNVVIAMASGLVLVAGPLFADEAKDATAKATEEPEKNVKVRYKKRTQVDFSSQNIEGKIRRPETALIEASEAVGDQGVLRLRENFLDKIASFSGEEVK